jgi:hypothetical protein
MAASKQDANLKTVKTLKLKKSHMLLHFIGTCIALKRLRCLGLSFAIQNLTEILSFGVEMVPAV